jgi:transposase-like protein
MGRGQSPLGVVSGSPACPFCSAPSVELVSQWGGQIITSQWRCIACGSYFEALREDFADHAAAPLTASSDEK